MSNLVHTNVEVAVVFWLSLAAVIIAAIVASVLKRKAGLAAIQHAIERGQQLDERTVRALLGRMPSKNRRTELLMHGSVWFAFGVGFPLFGWLSFEPPLRSILIGLGILMLCLGTGLLIASQVVGRTAAPGE
jgi:hypothetical protein